jgi:chemotaxis protein MotA
MLVVVGSIVVLVAVLVGFTMAGGHVGALLHLSEFITIGGASIGALIVMSPKKVIMDLVRGIAQLVKGSPYGKQTYAELFGLLAEMARAATACSPWSRSSAIRTRAPCSSNTL